MKIYKKIITKLLYFCGYELTRRNHIEEDSIHIKTTTAHIDKNILKANKINYGCGPKLIKGWLNVDIDVKNKKEYLTASVDLTDKQPFLDNQFQYGFSEDFIEHLSQSDQILFFQEVFRTFKKGGIIRLSFPGLEGILKEHYRPNYYDDILTAKQNAFTQWKHVNYLSKDDIKLICKQIGFTNIKFVKYGRSNFKALENLETRYLQKSVNTYVEITK